MGSLCIYFPDDRKLYLSLNKLLPSIYYENYILQTKDLFGHAKHSCPMINGFLLCTI